MMSNNNHVFDPTSPEPITNTCVFCGQDIADDVLNKPETICNDCHRPTCPDCIEDLKQTGLWGCWYCSTVDIDERNPEIRKELEKIREEKLKARRQPTERHRVEPIVSVSSSSTPIWPDNRAWQRMTAVANTEEYPYRDPPNPLDVEEGWGFVRPDMEDEVKPGDFVQGTVDVMGKVEKWNSKQADILGVVGSKMMINKVTASMKDLKRIADLIMTGEEIDKKAFGKDETYGQIYTRIDWNAADTIAGYTLNEDARSHIVAEILKELEMYYDPDRVVEEAQRGTGRTTQRIKSVFGHFIDGSVGPRKDFDSRRILYLVDSRREAKRVYSAMKQEWQYGFHRKLDLVVLDMIRERTDILPIKIALTSGMMGKRYTLVIADITYAALAQDGDKINRMIQYIGAPVIGDVIKG